MNELSKDAVSWLTVGEDAAGQRVDNFLSRILKGVPKSHIYRILRSGEVRINKGRVGPDARLLRVLRVARGRRQEACPAAAEHHVDAVAVRGLDELPGNVAHARHPRFRRQLAVVLPIAAGGVGIGASGRRVREAVT